MFDVNTKAALKDGDPDAFREVFRLLYPRLKGYCRLFIADQSRVDDIIQDSFLLLWDKRASIKTEKSIESFLFVIVRNRCLNFLKQINMEKAFLDLDKIQVHELQYLYQLDFVHKEEKSIEEMLIESFQLAVNDLPEKMKNVFIKTKLEGKKQYEVARELGISIKMVEKHISKAKQIIRKRLLKEYPALIFLISFLTE